MLLYSTSAAMRAMSSGLSSVRPSTEAPTGRQTPCDIGQTKPAIETRGDASHSPHPTCPPAATRTRSASWLPSASAVISRHGEIEEIDSLDLHFAGSLLAEDRAVLRS